MTDQLQTRRDPIEDDEIDLLQLFGQIWAGKVTIIVFAIFGVLAGLFYVLNTPPTYQADSLLQLEEKASQLGLPESLADLSGDSPRAVTEIEIIRSRMVVGRAVSRLNLDWYAAPLQAPVIGHLLATQDLPLPAWGFLAQFARPGDAIRLDLLDVPAVWLVEKIRLTAEGEGRFTLTLPNGQQVQGQVGEPVIAEDVGLSLRVGALVAEPGRVFILEQLSEIEAIARVADALSIAEQGRNSGILRMTYEADSPETARRTLDAIAQGYLSQNADRSAAEADSGLAFVESQLPAAREAVQEAEAALNTFRQDEEAINLSAEGEALLTQIRTLEAELIDLAAVEEEVAERYTRNHPEYQRLLNNRERIEDRLASLREEVRALPATQREVLNLTQDLELAREVFIQLRNRAQELQVLRASNIGNVRIVDTARTAERPVSPRKLLVLAIAGLLGLMCGTAVVLTKRYLRKTVDGSEELEAMGLPVFATLNRHPSAPQSAKGRKNLPLVAVETPGDLFVEGLRSLRTGLHFGMLDAQTRSVVFTSPAPGVGKSFISANLAVVAAQSGQKVCLIDADMRRGQQRKYFGLSKAHPGLAQVLSGEVELASALVPTQVENLSVLSSGPFPPNPSELLMREDLSRLIKLLDGDFDLIIIDAPPVLAVTDPVVLGRAAGAVIGVARFGRTHPGEVLAMKKTLETSGVKLSGAILNDFDPKSARGRYGYSYAYNARYSYKSGE
ncbi:acetyltransferase [Loktanella sp. 5RATIMAR09]|uniref:polysaccharide biosynthesis tyrosine autokinase n=1 Tax=Loktanella sp. 5RATIMAR09 TaxID=1225655 RepID=UPI0006EB8F67|nr:polysaccharide biosynthesis tyrosine autokinase [Loktanella sp. 5RATIMAR09]KQI71235.1 acetyltransferase [Loktanella sp. 5RATIMAR09]